MLMRGKDVSVSARGGGSPEKNDKGTRGTQGTPMRHEASDERSPGVRNQGK